MSILVAMMGSGASVVATDSRRIESDGTVHDDAKKTFRLPKISAVGGHTGLLEFGGKTIPEWLDTISLEGVRTMDEYLAKVARLLEIEMTKIADAEVDFKHRAATVVLIGRAGLKPGTAISIQTVEASPDESSRTVVSKIDSFPISCTRGEPAAQRVVDALLAKNGMQRLPRKRLHRFVRRLVAAGISASGNAPDRDVRACGGPPQFEYL